MFVLVQLLNIIEELFSLGEIAGKPSPAYDNSDKK
jgi:hypothetical protein